MNKRFFGFILISAIVLVGVIACGCKHDTIEFHRDSAVTSVINKFNVPKTQTKKNHGMLIIKDESSNQGVNINFGPRDINFDMPVKMK